MPDTPKYGFNRKPQFSANHMADYLACPDATQRGRIIRAAKFPQKNQVSAYAPVRRQLQHALTKRDFGQGDLEFLLARQEARERTSTGQAKNNARLCAQAIRCFKDTFNPRRFARYEISAAPRTLSRRVGGVRLNVSMDAIITETEGDASYAGGIILVYAFAADRGPIGSKLAAAAGLLLWSLEDGQMEPLPRLCLSVDLAEKKIVKASPSHERFRLRVTDSCHEAANRWDAIEPPHDYDGPDWR